VFWAPARHYVPATGLTRCNLLALLGGFSLASAGAFSSLEFRSALHASFRGFAKNL